MVISGAYPVQAVAGGPPLGAAVHTPTETVPVGLVPAATITSFPTVIRRRLFCAHVLAGILQTVANQLVGVPLMVILSTVSLELRVGAQG